jgi:hypothetical protein
MRGLINAGNSLAELGGVDEIIAFPPGRSVCHQGDALIPRAFRVIVWLASTSRILWVQICSALRERAPDSEKRC